MGIDWVQHYLWNETVDGVSAVETCYRYLDDVLGDLLDTVSEEWNVIVLSDHGAGPIDATVHLNSLLSDWGFLTEREPGADKTTVRVKNRLLNTAWSVGSRVPPSIKSRGKAVLPDSILGDMRAAAGVNQLQMHDRITWGETKAFSYGYMGRVFVNDTKRYPNGTVDPAEYDDFRSGLIDRFESLTNPSTGEPIVERAIPAEDVYSGPALSRGPDILLYPTDWRYMMFGDFDSEWFTPPGDRVADHDNEGILVCSGPEFNDTTTSADITDIAPTLAFLHGFPIAESMDGDVLENIFVPSFREEQAIRVQSYTVSNSAQADETSEDVESRLEDLGYL
jgi:predicted AlkP superfamily phosphohydrolase/phosphomutase